jgi:hypothetical protein
MNDDDLAGGVWPLLVAGWARGVVRDRPGGRQPSTASAPRAEKRRSRPRGDGGGGAVLRLLATGLGRGL